MPVNQKNCRELQVAAAFTSVMEELVEERIKFSLSILNHVPILAFPVCCWALLQYQKGRDWPVTLPVNMGSSQRSASTHTCRQCRGGDGLSPRPLFLDFDCSHQITSNTFYLVNMFIYQSRIHKLTCKGKLQRFGLWGRITLW